jgi:hypothetical protein
MIRLSLLTLALVGVAGVASAQLITSPPQPSPGDYQRQAPGLQPAEPQQAEMGAPSLRGCGHSEAMRDEYGFRYDGQGHRLNAQGCVISPHNTTP